jgi:hypothetical protein
MRVLTRIRCGGVLPSITKAAHPIAAAVTVIVIAGQWCRRKAWIGMPIEIAGAPAGRGFAGEEPPAHRTTPLHLTELGQQQQQTLM